MTRNMKGVHKWPDLSMDPKLFGKRKAPQVERLQ